MTPGENFSFLDDLVSIIWNVVASANIANDGEFVPYDDLREVSMRRYALAAVILAGLPSVAAANESITYTYDAQGRLVTVTHSGTVNNNVQATYSHDNVNNRTNVTVTS